MVTSILKKLKDLDINISFIEGDIELEGDLQAITEDLIEEISNHKSQLVKHLEEKEFIQKRIIPIESKEYYELSMGQKQIWISEESALDARRYNIFLTYRLLGDINVDFFKKAFKTVIEKNEILHSRFFVYNSLPCYKIIQNGWTTDFLTLIKVSPETSILDEVIIPEINNPIELYDERLFKGILIHQDKNSHVFMLKIHHIICDMWSLNIIMKEIIDIYLELISGKNEVKNLTKQFQYKDYAFFQQLLLKNKKLDNSFEYWKNKLRNLEHNEFSLDLLKDRRDIEDNWQRKTHEFKNGVLTELYERIEGKGTTLFVYLVTIIKILLYRYTNKKNINIDTVFAERDLLSLEDQIGYFINTVPLLSTIDPEKGIEDNLKEIQQVFLEAYENQKYPIVEVLKSMNSEEWNYSSLFQIVINYRKKEDKTFSISKELSVEKWDIAQTTTNYNLMLIFEESLGALRLIVDYNSRFLSEDLISRIIEHFSRLLLVTDKNKNIPVKDLDFISSEEKQQLLYEFNNSKPYFPKDKKVHELFTECAMKFPDKVVVSDDNGSFTYGFLDFESNRLANYFIQNNLYDAHVIGLMLEGSFELIVSILAIYKANNVVMHIEKASPIKRQKALIEDCSLFITDLSLFSEFFLQKNKNTSEFQRLFFELSRNHKKQKNGILSFSELINTACETVNNNKDVGSFRVNQDPKLLLLDNGLKEFTREMNHGIIKEVSSKNNVAYIMNTSGTSGNPKSVVIEHKSIVRLIRNSNFIVLNPATRLLQSGSVAFDAFTFEAYGVLCNGGELHFMASEKLIESDELKNKIDVAAINTMWFTSSWLNQIIESKIETFRNLQVIVAGGEKLSVYHINKLKNTFPSLEIINGYGPTENTTFSTYYKIEKKEYDNIPIGAPISNSKVYILDENGKILPEGCIGEICVGGEGVSLGYLNNVILTSEKFMFNPYVSGEMLYKTGDLGKWMHDGNISFLGRNDEQVKINGFRVELEEIESVIIDIEGVVNAKVLIDENKRIIAYVVAKNKITEDEVKEIAFKALPVYMHPHFFIFIDQFPITSNGKLDLDKLSRVDTDRKTDYQLSDMDELEIIIKGIWESVLYRKDIQLDDDFYEMGGDSIKSIQIASKLNEAGFKIRIKDIFQNSTIRKLKSILLNQKAETIYKEIGGNVPLSPIQKWFFKENFNDSHHFNQAVLLEVNVEIDLMQLRDIFQQVIDRHDMLKAIFKDVGEEIVQEIGDFSLDDILTEIQVQSGDNVDKIIENEANRCHVCFDLFTGPLFKLLVFTSEESTRILLIAHHLIIDAVSWRIILNDFNVFYDLQEEGTVQRSIKPFSYFQFIESINGYDNYKYFSEELEFWYKIESVQYNSIPRDFENENSNIENYHEELLEFNADILQGLIEQNKNFNSRFEDLLISAISLALSSCFNLEKFAITLEKHGREEINREQNLSNVVGWFTALFPIIMNGGLNNEDNIYTDIKSNVDILQSIPNNGFGYNILKYNYSEKSPKLSFNLNPQVSFNYLGDVTLAGSSFFEVKQMSIGQMVSPKWNCSYDIEILAYIKDKHLFVKIKYNSNRYKLSTITKLKEAVKYKLDAIILYKVTQDLNKDVTRNFRYQKLSDEEVNSIFN